MQSVFPPRLLLAPLPGSADCSVASVVSWGWGGIHQEGSLPSRSKPAWSPGPRCQKVGPVGGSRSLLPWASLGGWSGKPGPAQESGGPASPKVGLKWSEGAEEGTLKRLKEWALKAYPCQVHAGDVIGNFKLPCPLASQSLWRNSQDLR